jgi:hypothetical protein
MDTSIEILGQKFSYPTTWKGVVAIGCVCASICFVSAVIDYDAILKMYAGKGADEEKSQTELLAPAIQTIAALRAKFEALSDSGAVDQQTTEQALSYFDEEVKKLTTKIEQTIEEKEEKSSSLLTQLEDYRPEDRPLIISDAASLKKSAGSLTEQLQVLKGNPDKAMDK